MNQLFTSRNFRQGSIATGITVLVLAIVVVLNMLLSALSQRFHLQADLTANKLFGISKATVEYLDTLSKDVDIYILNNQQAFSDSDPYLKQANEVIQKYGQQSEKIHVSYVDLTRNAGFASRFPNENITSNNILVVCGEKVRTLTPYELFDVDTSNYYAPKVTASRAEQAMTSAIAGVVSDKSITIAILTGHDEASLSGLRPLLELNNYTLVDVNILTEEIPSEAVMAILSAPLRDYTEDELKKLDRFLSNNDQMGKTLFYMAGVDQGEMPALNAFLQEWNLRVLDGVVFETDSGLILNLSPYFPLVQYTEAAFSESLEARNLLLTVPTSRPLEILQANPQRFVTQLAQYSPKSGIQPLNIPEGWEPGPQDIVGPIPALLLSSQASTDGTAASHVLLCGTSLLVEQSILSSHVVANSEYILNVFNYLSNREETVSIQSKQMTTAQLGMTNTQTVGISLILVVILPLSMLILGAAVFFRRRHL